jgi:hypothetical protein
MYVEAFFVHDFRCRHPIVFHIEFISIFRLTQLTRILYVFCLHYNMCSDNVYGHYQVAAQFTVNFVTTCLMAIKWWEWLTILLPHICVSIFEGGSSKSHYVEESFWKRHWTCHWTDCWMMDLCNIVSNYSAVVGIYIGQFFVLFIPCTVGKQITQHSVQ